MSEMSDRPSPNPDDVPLEDSSPLEEQPAREPIHLKDLDVEEAKSSLIAPIELSGRALPAIDTFDVQKLAWATIDMIAERSREEGSERICINELAERARIGEGRVGERFTAYLPLFANLTIRGVYAQSGRRVFYEELSSQRTEVGRRHNGVGTDKVPGVREKCLRLLNYSLGASDRHCPAMSRELTRGTRWDHSSDRFGLELPKWAATHEGFIPGTFDEHVRLTLGDDRSARQALAKAMRTGIDAFTEDLTPDRLLAAFSSFLVVPAIPFGPPDVPYRDHADVVVPGRDDATIEEAERSGRQVLLSCGEPSPDEREEFEETARKLPIAKLPAMYELNIRTAYGVEHRWSEERQELGRYVAGTGAKLEIWRLVGADDEEKFSRMLALVERMSQVTWTDECMTRWETDCKPGMQKAHTPGSCGGVRALLAMANGGIVSALRRMAPESEFG